MTEFDSSFDPSCLVDANAMLGPLPTEDVGQGTAAETVKDMDRVGIGSAVVCHSHAWRHDPPSGNRLLVREIADEPRLLPCWVVLPDTCGELGGIDRFLADAERAGVAAFRAYPHDHGYALAGPDVAPLMAAMAERRRPLLVNADQVPLDEVEALAGTHPELPIVLCATGYRLLRRLAGVLARTGNVHVDLSYLGSHLGLEWLVERFGPSRLLFGTGAPARDRADAITRLLWSELDDTATRRIGGTNLLTLLGKEPA
ncbi:MULTISPECIES: amidohydrolase family protein [Amycolatopsis]|uniref:Amidohydrolase-related domain-containing protein n=2 Tax=Amycolatopsis TaxID=1813 RepID=A0A076N5Y0_AMYME|nr:amidohydrolase family protein [Amycolatopsis methanolica]AIJ26230.1 hypothetical protein AMETH_6138 [Amycolatopsis methanolica 239]